MERLHRGVGHATMCEVLQADVTPFVGVGHVGLHLAHGPFVGDKHCLSRRLACAFLVGKLALHHLDTILFSKMQQRLVVGESFLLHHEVDGTASFLA